MSFSPNILNRFVNNLPYQYPSATMAVGWRMNYYPIASQKQSPWALPLVQNTLMSQQLAIGDHLPHNNQQVIVHFLSLPKTKIHTLAISDYKNRVCSLLQVSLRMCLISAFVCWSPQKESWTFCCREQTGVMQCRGAVMYIPEHIDEIQYSYYYIQVSR